MKTALAAISFAAATSLAVAASMAFGTEPAQAQDFYSVHLIGLQVVQEGPRGRDDDTFIVAYVIEEIGNRHPAGLRAGRGAGPGKA